MTEDDLKKIEGMLSFHFGVMSGDFQKKIDLVVEGQQTLGERMGRLEERMDQLENRMERVELKGTVLEKKVDGVAADLSEHRRDTEAHRKGWRVREE
jgi:hypothetical protein